MSKTLTSLAVVILALAVTGPVASAQDFRSPDARPVVAKQDLRSPDARAVAAQPSAQDLRSPDAQPSGQFHTGQPATTAHASSSFDWAYLAIVLTIPLLLLAGYLIVRRERHTVAIGG